MQRRRWQVRRVRQQLQGIVTDVILGHFLADECFADDTLVQALAQQVEEILLLALVRVGLVFAASILYLKLRHG